MRTRKYADANNSGRTNRGNWRRATAFILGLIFCLGWAAMQAAAQTGDEGAIAGTVVDSSGAVVAGALVTATNVATDVKTARPTSGAGYYNIAPLVPGKYTVTVSAKGFEVFKQENMVIDAMHVSALNVSLKPGSQTETVTVTDAPPSLETTNAVLGATMENDVYMELPLLVSGNQQRDITQFSNLLPGAQLNPGGRSSVVGGTAQRLGELYLDGLPLTTISQQGDNRPIFNLVPMEAIDQIHVVTSSFSAEYQGAGLEDYSLKSGANKYHGTVADFIRNTIFDTWGFSAPWATVTNPKTGLKGYQNAVGTKPPDHQNELTMSVGGPISIPHLFSGHDKLFFYATYDRVHTRSAPSYGSDTLPTTLMQQGNFQELLSVANGGLGNTSNVNYPIYDPTSLAACTSHNGNVPCRYQYGYGPGTVSSTNSTNPGNPVLTGTPNVIPSSQISPIAQAMESFLPPLANSTTGVITNNYIGGIPSGYDNWLYAGHVDYEISSKQRLTGSVTGGNRHAVPYTSGSANLPVPYLAATISTVAGHWADLEHTYTIRPNLVNQLKYGWSNFGGPPVQNNTEGITKYEATTLGITGLPPGQASTEFPGSAFTGSNNETNWQQPDVTSTTVSNTLSLVDNLQWVKGKHAITAGIQFQWLEEQASTADGPSTPITLNWGTNETGQVNGSAYSSGTGFAYASYMGGAVQSSTDTLQAVSEYGGRYHPLAPYFQDDWKITRKLTLNLGMRWDYIPTYHEVKDRWGFLAPNVTNPYSGNLGVLEYAGSTGGSGVSIGQRTPVQTYWKHWGPRLGFAYAYDDKTVIRGGFGTLYSHAGGTGGAGGAATGTSNIGFTTPVTLPAAGTGTTAGPSFYLNDNPGFSAQNTNFGGPTFVLPTATGPSAAAQALNVGNYVTSTGAYVTAGAAPGYPDPYLSDRAPEFNFWNFGIQRELNKDVTLTVNYAGSESHFIAGAATMRGIQSGGIDPTYMAVLGTGGPTGAYAGPNKLGSLSVAATPANVAAAQAAYPGLPTPAASFEAAAATKSGAANATIGQSLKWMPQYSSTADTWGNIANANYHAFQVSISHRPTHGLSFTLNYTFSKEMDDAGTNRSGFAIPASLTLNNKGWARNRIDYSLSTLDEPQQLAAFGVYRLPFGKNGIGANSFLARVILGGWETSHILQYVSGMPLTLSSTSCSSYSVGQGTCMPDINPNYTGGKNGVRINGKWGQGVNALTLGTTQYVAGYIASTTPGVGAGGGACGTTTGPFCNAQALTIGDAARTGAFGLRAPNTFRLTSGLKRSFDITERFKFVFAVDCQNVTNAVTFGVNAGNLQIPTAVNTSSFGTLSYASADSRDFQFSGRITF
jgi:hypothetical protein